MEQHSHTDSMPQVFQYQGNRAIRTVMVGEEPWFVAKDVCEVLDLPNVGQALSRLDEACITSSDVWSPSNSRRYTLKAVNETGLYDLIFDSRKLEAKAFRRWVTGEVLPSIRRTGGYGAALAPAPVSAPPVARMPLVFKYGGAEPLRTVMVGDVPWFVAQDAGIILGIPYCSDAVRRTVPPEEWRLAMVPTALRKVAGNSYAVGNGKLMQLVTAQGLQALVLKSRRPGAQGFQRWVSEEVLPRIRRTGGPSSAGGPQPRPRPVAALPIARRERPLPLWLGKHLPMLATLDLDEAGAWLKLAAHSWATGGPLTADTARRLAGDDMLLRLQHLLHQEGGHYSFPWLEQERARADRLSAIRAASGSQGGRGNTRRKRRRGEAEQISMSLYRKMVRKAGNSLEADPLASPKDGKKDVN